MISLTRLNLPEVLLSLTGWLRAFDSDYALVKIKFFRVVSATTESSEAERIPNFLRSFIPKPVIPKPVIPKSMPAKIS